MPALNWHLLKPDRIGGAVVRRPFTRRGVVMRGGQELTRAEVLALPIANRNAMIESGIIEIFPVSGERFVVSAGKGLFLVVEGTRVTAEPITREQAEALAGKHA